MAGTTAYKKFEKIVILLLVYLFVCECKRYKRNKMLYILLWTPANSMPFPYLEEEQEAFKHKNCSYQNCWVTSDPGYLQDITQFDALLFNVVELKINDTLLLPKRRSLLQKYVLVSRESPVYYALQEKYNGYFNWVWSYHLDSDINFTFMTVKNKRGKIIAPAKDVDWVDIDDMKPTSQYVQHKLRNKQIAAAWFVSNCEANNGRSLFAENLKTELKKYGHKLDIFGCCGEKNCPRDGWEQGCHAMIETDYYFYLAFENSFAEDYVTEKLLSALEHFSVPVVYGGANYNRFMPDGIYLDACLLGPANLAKEMVSAIRDRKKYYEYFKWHRYYSFHDSAESPDSDGVCELCAKLNKYKKISVKVIKRLTKWWNGSSRVSKTCRVTDNNASTEDPSEIFKYRGTPSTTQAMSIFEEFLARFP